jgi:hypothetical protein
MPPRNHKPPFETVAGFTTTCENNLLTALATVYPPENIAKLKAALEKLDVGQEQSEGADGHSVTSN